MGATVEDVSGKFQNFQTAHASAKKKVRACVIFIGLLKFVCYLPFGLVI